MILLSVGSQLPFDRLARAVDNWCATTGRNDVIGQIGDPGADGYRPVHFQWSAFLAPSELNELLGRAELIVAHAGMGSIISALTNAKPIVIMPRRAALGEHRNDHQLATAARFSDRPGVYVAEDETRLAAVLEQAAGGLRSGAVLSPYADRQLTDSLRRYILGGAVESGDAHGVTRPAEPAS